MFSADVSGVHQGSQEKGAWSEVSSTQAEVCQWHVSPSPACIDIFCQTYCILACCVLIACLSYLVIWATAFC